MVCILLPDTYAHLNTETQTQSHAILTSHSTLQHTRIKSHAWSELKRQFRLPQTHCRKVVTLIGGGWQDYLTSLTMPKGAVTLVKFSMDFLQAYHYFCCRGSHISVIFCHICDLSKLWLISPKDDSFTQTQQQQYQGTNENQASRNLGLTEDSPKICLPGVIQLNTGI